MRLNEGEMVNLYRVPDNARAAFDRPPYATISAEEYIKRVSGKQNIDK